MRPCPPYWTKYSKEHPESGRIFASVVLCAAIYCAQRPLYLGTMPGYPVNPRHVTTFATVTDTDALSRALVGGVGRMQFLGFGMLLVRPADIVL